MTSQDPSDEVLAPATPGAEALPTSEAAKADDPRDEQPSEPKGGRPGPADHGGEGGMATRENAPELTESDKSG